MTVDLFIVVRTDRLKLDLRRYGGEGCPGPYGYHNGHAPLDNDAADDEDRPKPADEDPRWPVKCDHCDYAFVDGDNRQVFSQRYYAAEDGRRWPIHDLPPGAMYDAEWWPRKGPDGKWWVIMLPPGGLNNTWMLYEQAQGGGHWTVTGTAPKLTANPSILTPRYHGWLRDGKLVSC